MIRKPNRTRIAFEKPPLGINTPETLKELAQRLLQEPRIAVDTESNSLHAYQEQTCLLQLSIPDNDYLVDPLALDNLDALAPVFASPAIEKVFHAADYDLIVLQRDYGLHCQQLFDTMWGGRILGWEHVGLGDLLAEHFQLHANKRFQRYNWGRRPVSTQAVAYARMDTHYLLQLRELELAELQATGRWAEAQEIFHYLATNVQIPTAHTLETSFWRLKGVHDLNLHEKRMLYRLHLWREKTAQQLDRPPFKIIGRQRLIALAQMHARSPKGLQAAGLTEHQARRFGPELLRALREGPQQLPPYPPEEPRPPQAVINRYQTLHDWRKEVGTGRGVDSDVILPNATLWELAWQPPKTLADLLAVPGIGPWRQEHYGPDLLALLAAKDSFFNTHY
ncbi:MAG: HRDC domain-containing protein [Chloroflexota bacterium]|nr:HRDC domain-containing protein [Chloroflexota bacterium]